jgi:hypothetical protein
LPIWWWLSTLTKRAKSIMLHGRVEMRLTSG